MVTELDGREDKKRSVKILLLSRLYKQMPCGENVVVQTFQLKTF
jgi:hypothetical protein